MHLKTTLAMDDSGGGVSGQGRSGAAGQAAPTGGDRHERGWDLLQSLLAEGVDGVALFNRAGRLLWMNDRGRRALARPGSALVAWADLWSEDCRSAAQLAFEQAHRAGHGSFTGTCLSGRDERARWEATITAIPAETGIHRRWLCLLRDLSIRQKVERLLHEQVDCINRARDAIVVIDHPDCITFWNDGAERVLGWRAADVIGRPSIEIFGAGSGPLRDVFRAADDNEEARGEIGLRAESGHLVVLDAHVTAIRDESGRPIAHLCVASDVTVKRQLEERSLRSQRLEELGLLSAGIAHDLNNILSPILLAVPMLREGMHATDASMLEMIEHNAQRGANLVRQMLAFARGTGNERRTLEMKHLLRDIVGLVREAFPKRVEFETQIDPDLHPIRVNPTQLHQVLFNLCVNARDAMPHGGSLRLAAYNRVLGPAAASIIDGARAGIFVVCEVSDTGTGIPPDVLARMWEPFFSTKEPGTGTGLGLSTVAGIVRAHQGFVTVETAVGRGTTFRIWLPAAELNTATERSAKPVTGAGGSILAVDDDESVRRLLVSALGQQGYHVLTAADGAEAAELFARHVDEIVLVITDLQMPHVNGAAFVRSARRLNPQVSVLTISGVHNPERIEAAPGTAPIAFLRKPFHLEHLLTEVERLLAHSPERV